MITFKVFSRVLFAKFDFFPHLENRSKKFFFQLNCMLWELYGAKFPSNANRCVFRLKTNQLLATTFSCCSCKVPTRLVLQWQSVSKISDNMFRSSLQSLRSSNCQKVNIRMTHDSSRRSNSFLIEAPRWISSIIVSIDKLLLLEKTRFQNWDFVSCNENLIDRNCLRFQISCFFFIIAYFLPVPRAKFLSVRFPLAIFYFLKVTTLFFGFSSFYWKLIDRNFYNEQIVSSS